MADTFRITTYALLNFDTSPFTGTTYDLTLEQDLAADYFVMMYGGSWDSVAGTNGGLSSSGARVIGDGHGNLAVNTGALDVIRLGRAAVFGPWAGTVIVVECLGDQAASGFTLVDVVEHTMATTDTADSPTGAAWSDVDQVVPFGGWRGGGVEWDGVNGNSGFPGMANAATRIVPNATTAGQLDITRDATFNGSGIILTTFVVEWGSDWQVQRATVTGTASPQDAGGVQGDPATAAEAWDKTAITGVDPAKSWLWHNGYRAEDGIGDSIHGLAVALGDGLTVPGNPATTVAVGSRWEAARTTDVYVLTHADAAVDHDLVDDTLGSGDTLTNNFTVDAVGGTWDTASTPDRFTGGVAFGAATNTNNNSGAGYPRPNIYAYHTAATNLRTDRSRTSFVGDIRVQSIDLSGVQFAEGGATPPVVARVNGRPV